MLTYTEPFEFHFSDNF